MGCTLVESLGLEADPLDEDVTTRRLGFDPSGVCGNTMAKMTINLCDYVPPFWEHLGTSDHYHFKSLRLTI